MRTKITTPPIRVDMLRRTLTIGQRRMTNLRTPMLQTMQLLVRCRGDVVPYGDFWLFLYDDQKRPRPQ